MECATALHGELGRCDFEGYVAIGWCWDPIVGAAMKTSFVAGYGVV